MPKRLIALNLFFGALGVVFALLLVREMAFPRHLPPPPEPRAPRGAAALAPTKAAPEDLSAYAGIVSRHLFDSARSGAAVVTPGGMSFPEARLFLYGVVVDGVQTRAYLSNPATKRVSSFRVGDTVAGWRVQRIGEDRVVMASPEGSSIEVMLRDPSKPQSAASASPTPAQPLSQPAGPSPPGMAQPVPGERVSPRTEATRGELAPPLPQGIPRQLFRPAPPEGGQGQAR